MTVRRLLSELDSEELAEWFVYNERWPITDSWRQTARICRTIMASSGRYRKVPDEDIFIPASAKPTQSPEQMAAELAKLKM